MVTILSMVTMHYTQVYYGEHLKLYGHINIKKHKTFFSSDYVSFLMTVTMKIVYFNTK